MGIYRLNGNFAVRLESLQLYIYWGALKGLNYGRATPYEKTHQASPERAEVYTNYALSGRKFRLVSFLRRALPYAIY